ncbi:MAG: hypothetical protein MJZ24_01755 [Paludibacteraceae bacterium]|nr:hypothetical protein [Paludibacteraceae bacterium]
MKKLILSLVTMASLAFAANAGNVMRVHTSDGHHYRYDVKEVTEVDYMELTEDELYGVTVSGKEGDYTFVDLGLPSGTKWATYNVGATKPTEYGDYFAWGETKAKEDYCWETYKWCKGSDDSMTKYCTNSEYGTVDNKRVLDAEDDAATANWGSAWRMPTREEIEELLDGCYWEWVKNFNGSGVNGRLGTSKKNGATIFLPAAGYRDDTYLRTAGDIGLYWLSSLDERYLYDAHYLRFSEYYIRRDDYIRYLGQSVRAVLR